MPARQAILIQRRQATTARDLFRGVPGDLVIRTDVLDRSG
jgi:hypothetical protein